MIMRTHTDIGFFMLMSLYLLDMKIIINESQLRLITENQISQTDPVREAHYKSRLDMLNALKIGDKWPKGMKPPGDFRVMYQHVVKINQRKNGNDQKLDPNSKNSLKHYDDIYMGFCKYASEFVITPLRQVTKVPSVKMDFEDLREPKYNEELGERSRTLANTRKKRLFPKSAMKSNPDRFKKYDRDLNVD